MIQQENEKLNFIFVTLNVLQVHVGINMPERGHPEKKNCMEMGRPLIVLHLIFILS